MNTRVLALGSVLICGAFLAPSLADAQTGRCTVVFGGVDACVDFLTEPECTAWASGEKLFWTQGETCTTDEEFIRGSCYIPDAVEDPPLAVCAILGAESLEDAMTTCEKGARNVFFEGETDCPIVPAVPAEGQGLLFLALLVGAVIVLKLR